MHNRNCRAPDVSFIPKARLRQLGFRPSPNASFPARPTPLSKSLPLKYPFGNRRAAEGLLCQWHPTCLDYQSGR
jgi:hypothetical protein